MNVDQKTPDNINYSRHEFPPGTALRDLDDENNLLGQNAVFGISPNKDLAKSKFPAMLGMLGQNIDPDGSSKLYSQQSSVVSQWEDRIISGDEDGGETEGDKLKSFSDNIIADAVIN